MDWPAIGAGALQCPVITWPETPDPPTTALPAPTAGDKGLFFQLFDASPFPAVVTRLLRSPVLAINQRTSDVFGISHVKTRSAVTRPTTTWIPRNGGGWPNRSPGRAGRTTSASSCAGRVEKPSGPRPRRAWSRSRAEPAVLVVFKDITAEVAAEQTLRASEERLAAQSQALTTLTAQHAVQQGSFKERLRTILQLSATTLDAGRLSLWRLADDGESIRCEGLYCLDPGGFSVRRRAEARAGAQLLRGARTGTRHRRHRRAHRSAHPRFQGELPARRVASAPCSTSRCARASLRGVLCAEHVGGPRTWTVDEQNFAISTANLVVMALTEQDRLQALARLADSEARSRLIVDTAHDAFIGIDTGGRIVTWNAQAEATLGWTRDEALGRDMARPDGPSGVSRGP